LLVAGLGQVADVVDAADVRVRDLARESDLGQEALALDRIAGESAAGISAQPDYRA
jgi:hypothetical protein